MELVMFTKFNFLVLFIHNVHTDFKRLLILFSAYTLNTYTSYKGYYTLIKGNHIKGRKTSQVTRDSLDTPTVANNSTIT